MDEQKFVSVSYLGSLAKTFTSKYPPFAVDKAVSESL